MIQRSRMEGNEENNSGRGRMKKTSVPNDTTLFGTVRNIRGQTLNDVTSRFNVSYEQDISARTVRRRLFEEGYF